VEKNENENIFKHAGPPGGALTIHSGNTLDQIPGGALRYY